MKISDDSKSFTVSLNIECEGQLHKIGGLLSYFNYSSNVTEGLLSRLGSKIASISGGSTFQVWPFVSSFEQH